MTVENSGKVEMLWRLAPWLTVAAMTMTVVSFDPVEAKPYRHVHHAVDAHECNHQETGHDSHVLKDGDPGARG